jgi:osmotically inducible protein OsmC
MPSVVSKARAVWEGDLFHGKGVVSFDSGAFQQTQVTWAARSSKVAGMTSPEELLAAAHASCFAMALSNILAKEGRQAQQLDVTAEVTFTIDGGARISSVTLTVVARFRELHSRTSRRPRLRRARAAQSPKPSKETLR